MGFFPACEQLVLLCIFQLCSVAPSIPSTAVAPVVVMSILTFCKLHVSVTKLFMFRVHKSEKGLFGRRERRAALRYIQDWPDAAGRWLHTGRFLKGIQN